MIHLVLLLNEVQVIGVPIIAKRTFRVQDNPSAHPGQNEGIPSSTQEHSVDGASLERDALLDRVAAMKNPEVERQHNMVSEKEDAELAKYIRNGYQERHHEDTSSISPREGNAENVVKQQVDILKPRVPPFDVLTPSDDSHMADYGLSDQSLEPSPYEEMILYPSPEETVNSDIPISEVVPSYSPIPNRYDSKPTHPSLAKVVNEDGSFTYKPWNSIYVFVRQVLGLDSQGKSSTN